MDRKQIAKKIIESNLYLTLATSDGETPWAAPVFYAVDGEYNFYFISPADSVHVQHLLKNPQVAVAIFDSHQREGTATGLQVKGTARLVEEKDYSRVIEIFNKKRKSLGASLITLEMFQGTERRMFKIEPSKFYVPDEEYWKTHRLDRRVEVTLD